MASKVDRQKLQDLVCPLCLDVFKNPTLLSCGHTFCRECLEAYDEQHHHDHIVCPVCRESTNLGQKRVAGLKPNFIARDMQDKLHVVPPSQSFCPLHTNVHNDIFCEDCTQWICLTCFIESHKDHKIKKKEELEGDLRKKRDSLISRSEMRKAQIEKCVDNAEQRRIDTHSHYSRVEKEIKDEFAKKVTILKQKEESLLKKIDSIRKETENQFVACIANIRQAIDDTKKSIEMLRGYTGENVNSDLMKTQYLQFRELEQSLETRIPVDEASTVRLKETAESSRFRPSDEKLLAIGHIHVEEGMKERKTATAAKRKSKQPPAARKKVAVIPQPVRSKSLNIVRQVEAPGDIYCMAAAQSQDAVVVGYGSFGSDRFSVAGEKTEHLKSEVGDVWDIAFLTDGRSVVSHDDNTLRVYSTDRHSTGMQYTCREGKHCIEICVDQDDNIYAINGNPEIYIFHGSNPNPQRVIPTGDIKPEQICVTKTGALITRSWEGLDTLTVFDREGHVGSSITASDEDTYLLATVDSQDRVLVARAKRRSDVFRLTRYTLQGTTLIEQMTFNALRLPRDIITYSCYMASLEPKLIAFAHKENLYFIELSE